jgi:hypothetical protein
VNEATSAATSGAGPTSAEVPHKGASPGNSVATANGAEEAQGGTMLTDEQVLQLAHTPRAALTRQGMVASMSRTGDCLDNAVRRRARARRKVARSIKKPASARPRGIWVCPG